MVDELLNRLEDVQEQLIGLLVGILQLLIVFIIAALVARWFRRRIRRRVLTAQSPVLGVVAENSAVVGVYVVAMTVVLGFWGLTWAGLVTALSIGTIAVAFGLQDLLRSLVGGILVLIERPFVPGDRIRIRDAEGVVERVDLRTTVLRSDNGDRIAMPNALMFTDLVVNRSPNQVSRILTVSRIEGRPSELKQRAEDALAGLPGLDGPLVITVRTRMTGRRVRRALDALPGIERGGEQSERVPRGVGLRIVGRGERNPATLDDAKRRLQAAFPDAIISG